MRLRHRKEIFRYFVSLEDKKQTWIINNSYDKHNNPLPKNKIPECPLHFQNLYRRVANEFNITEKDMKEIVEEGINNDWQLPETDIDYF